MNNAENRRMQQNFNNQQALAKDRQAAEMEMVRQQNQVTDQRWRDQQAAEQQQWRIDATQSRWTCRLKLAKHAASKRLLR